MDISKIYPFAGQKPQIGHQRHYPQQNLVTVQNAIQLQFQVQLKDLKSSIIKSGKMSHRILQKELFYQKRPQTKNLQVITQGTFGFECHPIKKLFLKCNLNWFEVIPQNQMTF